MKRAAGTPLGAVLGLGFGTMGLVNTRNGFDICCSSENSVETAAVVVAMGAIVGGVLLKDRPLTLFGAIVGLALAIWLRDNADDFGTVQAPKVFLLLFGLPLLGAVIGWVTHEREIPRGTHSYGARSARAFREKG